MQVADTNFFRMQNWAQNAARQNAQVNPLLEQAINAIEKQGNAKDSGPVSKEMEAKIRQNTEEAKIDPKERALRKAREEMMFAEQDYYRDLGFAKAELVGMQQEKEIYTHIMNGTADYDNAYRCLNIGAEDSNRFDFIDFQSYLDTQGYQRKSYDGNESLITDAKYVYAPSANGIGSVIINEDQVPFYEQWLADNQAHKAEQLKEYATAQMPKLQARIASFPDRIRSIAGSFALRRAAIMEKYAKYLDDDELKNYKNAVGEIDDLVKEMGTVDRTDDKKMLDLLNQILGKQQQFVKDLGGQANNVYTGIVGGVYHVPMPKTIDAYAPLDTYV